MLPHEITHTIFATHFGCPLPRWADEGAATSVEHASERTKQDQLLIQFLTSNRGIAFNHMFAMKEYPPDILPLYSQGYSLARYLIAQGGRRKYVDYVFDGMHWNNWTAATRKHYGLSSLSELQVTWLAWVRQGSPDIRVPAPDRHRTNLMADNTPNDSAVPSASAPGDSLASTDNASGLVPLPARVSPRPKDVPLARTGMTADGDMYTNSAAGWYTRERDRALNPSAAATTDLRPATPPGPGRSCSTGADPTTQLAHCSAKRSPAAAAHRTFKRDARSTARGEKYGSREADQFATRSSTPACPWTSVP